MIGHLYIAQTQLKLRASPSSRVDNTMNKDFSTGPKTGSFGLLDFVWDLWVHCYDGFDQIFNDFAASLLPRRCDLLQLGLSIFISLFLCLLVATGMLGDCQHGIWNVREHFTDLCFELLELFLFFLSVFFNFFLRFGASVFYSFRSVCCVSVRFATRVTGRMLTFSGCAVLEVEVDDKVGIIPFWTIF
jgi:hypothetical protein